MPSDYISKSALLKSISVDYPSVINAINDVPTLDLVPTPLKCGECIYWKDRQIQMQDGTCRDYGSDDEYYVDSAKGINVSSHCTLHGYENESGSWFWSKADDFCSRSERKDGAK